MIISKRTGVKITRDNWLSDLFGYDAFKIAQDVSSSPESIPEVVSNHLTKYDKAFCFAKCPSLDTGFIRALSLAGLYVVDGNITFEIDPTGAAPEKENLIVRDVDKNNETEIEKVINIAETAFVYSRFHLDPLVSDDLANKIKGSWIRSYVAGTRGVKLLVAEEGGQPAGFLAVLESAGNYIIDLIGVDPSFQKKGIGKSLIVHFQRLYWEKAKRLIVGTQISNIPSMRLYQKCGFRISEIPYVMHGHFNSGKPNKETK